MRTSIVAWDLDETLGSWVQLGFISDSIRSAIGRSLSREEMFRLINLFPEYVRPGIVPVLQLLKKRMQSNNSLKVILFTNNNGPQSWAKTIVAYFNHLVDYNLFSTIIPAFEVKGRRVSKCRTSSDKLYSDLVRCIDVPAGTPVCFIDDQEHPGMRTHDVKYIRVDPYSVVLSPGIIARRLTSFTLEGKTMTPQMAIDIEDDMKAIGEPVLRPSRLDRLDLVLFGKKLETKIISFLGATQKTRRRRIESAKKTQKIRQK